jgi:hypothetical protein
LPLFGWWYDWWDRRSALSDLRASQLAGEASLQDKDLNPLSQAKAFAERGDTLNAALHWDHARSCPTPF